jgi:hypothetical protein
LRRRAAAERAPFNCEREREGHAGGGALAGGGDAPASVVIRGRVCAVGDRPPAVSTRSPSPFMAGDAASAASPPTGVTVGRVTRTGRRFTRVRGQADWAAKRCNAGTDAVRRRLQRRSRPGRRDRVRGCASPRCPRPSAQRRPSTRLPVSDPPPGPRAGKITPQRVNAAPRRPSILPAVVVVPARLQAACRPGHRSLCAGALGDFAPHRRQCAFALARWPRVVAW